MAAGSARPKTIPQKIESAQDLFSAASDCRYPGAVLRKHAGPGRRVDALVGGSELIREASMRLVAGLSRDGHARKNSDPPKSFVCEDTMDKRPGLRQRLGGHRDGLHQRSIQRGPTSGE